MSIIKIINKKDLKPVCKAETGLIGLNTPKTFFEFFSSISWRLRKKVIFGFSTVTVKVNN